LGLKVYDGAYILQDPPFFFCPAHPRLNLHLEICRIHVPQTEMAPCVDCDSASIMHICVMSVFAFIAIVSVIMRLVARKIQRTRIELNDYLCVLALVEQL
jgi:hypothetical protein